MVFSQYGIADPEGLSQSWESIEILIFYPGHVLFFQEPSHPLALFDDNSPFRLKLRLWEGFLSCSRGKRLAFHGLSEIMRRQYKGFSGFVKAFLDFLDRQHQPMISQIDHAFRFAGELFSLNFDSQGFFLDIVDVFGDGFLDILGIRRQSDLDAV